MKRLQIGSMIILVIGVSCFLLWHFVLVVPDLFVRITGIVLAISLFTLAFSSIRLYRTKH